MLAATAMLATAGATAANTVRGLFDQTGQVLAAHPDPAMALHLLGEGMKTCMLVLLPISAAMAGIGVAGQLAQVGNAATLKMLKPKFSKLNLFKGLKRLVSPQSLWEAGKALIKRIVLGELTRRAIMSAMPKLLEPGIPVDSMVALVVGIVMGYVRDVAMAGLALAVVDYAMVRRRINKSLKMTKQEIKEESKSAEGNPRMKGAIRSKQMAMSRMRMMAEVASSNVVVTNPTHIAVALKYDPIKGAPRVVAKGSGSLAERIKAEATEHRVPIVRDVPLARTLNRVCDLGDEIPAELFEAVARVLAFVFALKRRGSAAGEHAAASGLLAEVDLPGVNMRIGVRVDGCCQNDLKTRVDNVAKGVLVVVAPLHRCGMAMPYDGTKVHVRWSEQGAAMEVPAEIARTGLRPLAVWELRVTGSMTRVQRRRYVRVETPALPVEMRVGGTRVSAWLADLSEGGLRCTMERWAAAGLSEGDSTVTWLRLGDGLNLALPAQVVRVEKGHDGHVDVACQFVGIPSGTADQLRKYVFAEQARQRRREAGLDD